VTVVTAGRRTGANFYLASWILGPTRTIRLIAHPIGSPSSIDTELIHVQPGQFIDWHLENDLTLSSVAVY